MVKMKSLSFCIFLSILLIFNLVSAQEFIEDFREGNFQNTFYDNYSLKLSPGNLTGSYIGRVFDAESSVNWTYISLNSNNIGELKNNKSDNLMNGNVLLYHLNEILSNITDYSGNNNSANCTNPSCPNYTVNGKFSGAYIFDGIDDYLVSNVNYNNTYTVSVWFKPYDLLNVENFGRTIVASSPNSVLGYGFWFLVNGNKIRVYSYAVNSNSYTLSNYNNISSNKWYNLIVSANRNGESKIYINGALDKTFTSGNQLSAPYVTLGELRPNRKIAFNGTIDDVSIWNRTLSLEEVKEIYSSGVRTLNLSIRSCENFECNNTNWTLISEIDNKNINLSGRYFQYKLNLGTSDLAYTPEVYTVRLNNSLQENNPENPVTYGGPTAGTTSYDKDEDQIVYSISKKEFTKQLVIIILFFVIFISLIILLIYLIRKIIK